MDRHAHDDSDGAMLDAPGGLDAPDGHPARDDLPEATLCHLVDGDETLLVHKKRGVGSDQWVGPGGKCEPGETPHDCVVREVREEVGLRVRDPEKVGEFAYYGDDWDALVHVFRATDYDGTPVETAEARPVWFPVDDLPLDEMWATDREWLPTVLDGGTFRGRFVYSAGDPADVTVETGVAFHSDETRE